MKKRTVIIVIIISILVIFVLPFGSGRMTDGGTTFYTPMVFHWYIIHDYSTRRASVPVYPHDGEEHEPPKTKTVFGGIDIYLFGQKVYDTKRMTKSVVPSKITITSGKDGVDVFKQTINVW